jgi:hypothetical protein
MTLVLVGDNGTGSPTRRRASFREKSDRVLPFRDVATLRPVDVDALMHPQTPLTVDPREAQMNVVSLTARRTSRGDRPEGDAA